MKKEMLRMERVTYNNQGINYLTNFNITIWEGEILGLIPVNNYGLETLFSLLKQNLPLHYGYVYYKEELINDWRNPSGGTNRISIIQNKSSLAGDLTVADNVFVLRQGFKKWFMQPEVLKKQLLPFMEEIGVNIKADAYVEELSVFEKFIVELLKAVVAGSKLIVLENIGTLISDSELSKLHEILRHYADKGFSFLYITSHHEEARLFCDRTAFMLNGQITKYFQVGDRTPDTFLVSCVEDYDKWIRQQFAEQDKGHKNKAVFELRAIEYGNLRNFNLMIEAGECVVLQDLDNGALEDLFELLAGETPLKGQILIEGKALRGGSDRRKAVIQELPTETMMFHHMSYMDNLCFNMDHQFKKIWLFDGIRKSIIKEYRDILGADVFHKRIAGLSTEQKYDLVYTRILLQNPRVVFCIQPFKGAEVSMRSHIWELLERFLEKGIAVVILAVNLADSLALADRLVRVKYGTVQEVYDKEEFIKLPIDTPWLYLYQEKYASENKKERE